MKVCPHCHKELPEDSEFCIYCGKSLLDNHKDENEKSELHKNPRQNHWAKLGLCIFLFSLVCLDFILATVLNAFHLNYKIIFMMSSCLYIIAIGCGFMSILLDHKDKKNGYLPNGNYGMALVSMVMSFYVILVNLNSVLF